MWGVAPKSHNRTQSWVLLREAQDAMEVSLLFCLCETINWILSFTITVGICIRICQWAMETSGKRETVQLRVDRVATCLTYSYLLSLLILLSCSRWFVLEFSATVCSGILTCCHFRSWLLCLAVAVVRWNGDTINCKWVNLHGLKIHPSMLLRCLNMNPRSVRGAWS
jgi:hypothetical protein